MRHNKISLVYAVHEVYAVSPGVFKDDPEYEFVAVGGRQVGGDSAERTLYLRFDDLAALESFVRTIDAALTDRAWQVVRGIDKGECGR